MKTKIKMIKTNFLAIDIGNTTITFGVLKGNKVLAIFDIPTRLTVKEVSKRLAQILAIVSRRFGKLDVWICSVVPTVTAMVEQRIRKEWDIAPMVIGRDFVVPIVNRYRDPKQVGQDRLVGALAAKNLFGTPVIIIDLGTAITFDVVSAKGHYEGGMIIPGIQLSADTLFQRTALLPRIETIKGPRALIGKDTQESILSGIFHGYGAMCSGLIEQLAHEFRAKPKVILTGGYSKVMRKYIACGIDKVDVDLVFKGIAFCRDEVLEP